MHYWRFDPSTCGFPAARLPMLPAPGLRDLLPSWRPGGFHLIDVGRRTRFFTRARYALLEAFRGAGVGPEGALLAPAYHCRTMLDPAIQLRAPVLLYSLNKQLQPNLDSVTRCLEQSAQQVKALLLPHYFGFAQPLQALSDLCRDRGVALIEDCSHLLVTGTQAATPALGQAGHWTVASPYKFFSCVEGGLLWSGDSERPVAGGLKASPLREVRTFLRALRASCPSQLAPSAAQFSAPLPPGLGAAPVDCDDTVSDPLVSSAFVPGEAGLRGAPWARWLMRLSSVDRLAQRRRRHYLRLHAVISALPNCRALFDALPPDTVPYMVPVHIEHPDPHFFLLKRLGVPVGRWDDLAASDCPVATDYRLHLIHLPCHQALSNAQVDWMCQALKTALTQPVVRP